MSLQSDLARKHLAETKFVPEGASAEARLAHAAEYTAFYLGEIENHLATIVGHLQNETANSAKIAMSLQGIAHILPNLSRDR